MLEWYAETHTGNLRCRRSGLAPDGRQHPPEKPILVGSKWKPPECPNAIAVVACFGTQPNYLYGWVHPKWRPSPDYPYRARYSSRDGFWRLFDRMETPGLEEACDKILPPEYPEAKS